jgi:hypothetical protein
MDVNDLAKTQERRLHLENNKEHSQKLTKSWTRKHNPNISSEYKQYFPSENLLISNKLHWLPLDFIKAKYQIQQIKIHMIA